MDVLKDKLGKIVRPGDLVVGAALRYKSAELRIGVVERIRSSLSITVMRVTEINSYNKGLSYSFRRHTAGASSYLVLRWDLIDKGNKYYDILFKLKEKIMKH